MKASKLLISAAIALSLAVPTAAFAGTNVPADTDQGMAVEETVNQEEADIPAADEEAAYPEEADVPADDQYRMDEDADDIQSEETAESESLYEFFDSIGLFDIDENDPAAEKMEELKTLVKEYDELYSQVADIQAKIDENEMSQMQEVLDKWADTDMEEFDLDELFEDLGISDSDKDAAEGDDSDPAADMESIDEIVNMLSEESISDIIEMFADGTASEILSDSDIEELFSTDYEAYVEGLDFLTQEEKDTYCSIMPQVDAKTAEIAELVLSDSNLMQTVFTKAIDCFSEDIMSYME